MSIVLRWCLELIYKRLTRCLHPKTAHSWWRISRGVRRFPSSTFVVATSPTDDCFHSISLDLINERPNMAGP
jgi:hypothetical protein